MALTLPSGCPRTLQVEKEEDEDEEQLEYKIE